MELTIITPYYKCLNEIKELATILEPQLTSKTEWIIVDDGCNEKELDKIKAKIIHLDKNSGNASKPRNIGLDNAKGKYVCFIDADDKVSKNYVKTILNKINESDFDYCYFSWESPRGKYIINEEPPSWNTCVWNCIYKRELIGNIRFDEKRNVAEDEYFNKQVRKGKRENIKEILYYYNWGRDGSLTNLVSKGIIPYNKGNEIQCGLLLYQKYISKIGGIETFLYEFVSTFNKIYDITLVYKEADINQLNRLKQYVRCIEFNNQNFICDKYICVSNQDNIEKNVYSKSGEYIDMMHADISKTGIDWQYHKYNKTTLHIAVSELAKKGLEEQDSKIPTKVIYNLYNKKEIKRPIKIMSAQRVSVEKGENEMKLFARKLTQKGIPFIWVNFTDNKIGEEEGIMYRSPVMDIENYYGAFDYFASFSKTESYGYSIVQALVNGLPLIVRDIPVLQELGFNDKMGYVIKQDMSNIDEVIDKIQNIPSKFEYKQLDDKQDWLDLLGELNKYNDYGKELKMKYLVEALDTYKNMNMMDGELGYIPEEGERWEVSKQRLDVLLGENKNKIVFVKLIGQVEPDEEPIIEEPKKEVKKETKKTTRKK